MHDNTGITGIRGGQAHAHACMTCKASTGMGAVWGQGMDVWG